MTKELTAEEYRNLHRPLYGSEVVTYGDLRAKEAVEKFARELIELLRNDTLLEYYTPKIKHLAKQHGVNL
jgi:hypothetical protein